MSRPTSRSAIVAFVLFAWSCQSGGAKETKPTPTEHPPATATTTLSAERAEEPRHLKTPAHLPETARDLVWERMQGHGTDTTLLLWAVLFVDYEGARELSRAILSEPRFSRPIAPDDSTLNSLLPEEFFDLQDELVVKAKALLDVTTSKARDGAALSKAFGELTSVCVRCHAAYIEEPPRVASPAR